MSEIKKHGSFVLVSVIISCFLFGAFTLYTASESGEPNTDYNLPAPSSEIESYLRSITSSLSSIQSTLNSINSNLSSIESKSGSSKSYLYDIESHLSNMETDLDDVEAYLRRIADNTD